MAAPTSAQLRLTDPTVSRNHCVIRMTAKGPLLRDLASTNGSRIDGVEVREAYVPRGATLELGHTQVRFEPLDESVELPLADSERFGRAVGPLDRDAAPVRARRPRRRVRRHGADRRRDRHGQGRARRGDPPDAARARPARSIVVDCGAVPPNLFESELFGHERGAFTGADRARAGAFEEADGGTLFLDEIGELPLPLQPKLLRVLEAREVRRIGSAQARKVNVRVVAATNRDLREEVNRGTFRQDLYFRLEVMRLRVPPLRERPDDIPVLVEHFRSLAKPGDAAAPFSDETMRNFVAPPVAGQRARAAQRGRAPDRAGRRPVHVRPPRPTVADGAGEGEPVDIRVPFKDAKNALTDRFERRYLTAMLEATGGNISEAARRAGIDRVYLLRLMGRYGLRKPRE